MARSIAAGLLLALGSCVAAPLPPPGLALSSLDYTLAPGEERYFCYAMTLPLDEETVITAYRPEYGAGTHHIFFGYTLDPEPEPFSECPVLSRNTWVPLFLGGVRTSDLELPAGAGVRLVPGTQIFMQLHLQNPTTEAITARTAMHLETAPASEDLVPAGVFGFDDRTVVLPPRSTDVETTIECMPGRRMEVFGLLAHMHQYGTLLELWGGPAGAERLLHSQVWDFNDQPTTAVSFVIEPTDNLRLRCLHNNPTDAAILYGESSLDEMCAGILYYTPFEEIDACLDVPPSP